jgi:hypothetical protein
MDLTVTLALILTLTNSDPKSNPNSNPRPGGMEKPRDDFEETHNMKLHMASTKFGGLISRKQIASLCVASALNPDIVSNRILEVTADPSYPKLTPLGEELSYSIIYLLTINCLIDSLFSLSISFRADHLFA